MSKKAGIQVTYKAHYTLLVQSETMKPNRVEYPLQPDGQYPGVYDEKGKLINNEYRCLIDPPSGMHSVKVKESGQTDIEVEQFCSGAGGHSADGLGIIRTTYRYDPKGWKIVASAYTYTGQ